MIRRLIKRLLAKRGLEIRRIKAKEKATIFNMPMRSGLERVKTLHPDVNTIVDVGAAQGSWSLSARELWPNASFLLFEPLTERNAELQSITQQHANFHFFPLAVGKERGTVNFSVTDDLDGSGIVDDPNRRNVRSVHITSLQHEITTGGFGGPFIIKLDTHGYEIPILEGCRDILRDVSLFIIESYGFHIAPNSLLFWEMCRYMDGLGFRLVDIVDVMNRKKDGAFWQCDAFFIRKEHPLFKDNGYT